MRTVFAIVASVLLVGIAHAELQNVQVGPGIRIRANYYSNQPPSAQLTVPSFYDSLLSAAEIDLDREPPSATFGTVSIKIGMDAKKAIARLSDGFTVLMTEPDRALSAVQYQIIANTGEDKHRGSFLVDEGKVVRVTTVLGRFNESDAGSIMKTIVDALDAVENKNEDAPRVDWNTGIFQNQKMGNRDLTFQFKDMTIAVVYFDSPGATQNVLVTQTIGTNRWRSYPRAGDFRE
ncbi:MAG: hypothetical protein DHS20C16_35120 [Phycisphaerae bacterium]|nr:MAG: hypothetical protein DHS20C16_35120 [Phycisphaerae bacterium]